MLLTHLPPDAAVYRTGPDDQYWSIERQGIADLHDLVGSIGEKYTPVRRPGDIARQQAVEDAVFERATLYAERAETRRRIRQREV